MILNIKNQMEDLIQKSKIKSQNYNSKLKTDLKYRCYYFSIAVIQFLELLPEKRVFRIIGDQLLRSATSIGANIIEAKSASPKRDFTRFYEIALKSSNETKYWFGLLRDAANIDKDKINEFLKEADEISKIISASVITLKNRRKF